jgi:hypothetical protein
MGWETRKGRLYYYTKERIGERVVSIYHGTGASAGLISELAELRRADREKARAEDLAEIQRMQDEDGEISALDDLVVALTQEALISAGFHQHRGTWRRKRNGKK